MSALKVAHLIRGVSTEALEDSFVKALLVRGVINKDSLVQKDSEAMIDFSKKLFTQLNH